MLAETKKIARSIALLQIQGATNILKAVQEAVLNELNNAKQPSLSYFYEVVAKLWHTRPTEPAMKDFLTRFMLILEEKGFVAAKKFVESERKSIEKKVKEVVKHFSKSIKHNLVFFTHCHSSIVEACLIELNKKGLVEFVVNTETRPLFQGRITAKRLASAGIKVKHIVDSAAYALAKNLIKEGHDLLFVTGCDVITNRGDIINKIGTAQINLGLKSLGIEHYVVTTSNKVDVVDKNWTLEKVELRDWKEVWKEKPKNVEILNYAFDVTPFDRIDRIYYEKGYEKPQAFVLKHSVDANYKYMWHKLDNLKI